MEEIPTGDDNDYAGNDQIAARFSLVNLDEASHEMKVSAYNKLSSAKLELIQATDYIDNDEHRSNIWRAISWVDRIRWIFKRHRQMPPLE